MPAPGPSLSGMGGALLAIVILIAIGAAFLSDGDEMFGLMFPALAILFIPALVVSATAIPRRKGILQATTVAAMVIALGGGIVDFGIPLIMALPTVLLAQAAGLLFGAARD
ncbi:MAG: hypothetical protein ABIP58_08835 [Dehalococcoidia bacterium]